VPGPPEIDFQGLRAGRARFDVGTKLAPRTGMKIEVLNTAAGDAAQMRAYAEYRVFSRLAPLARHVAAVTVVITPSSDGRTLCVVTLEFESGLRIKREGRHAHPVLAIDAATTAIATAAHSWATRLPHGA
jgi:hypothetical protein